MQLAKPRDRYNIRSDFHLPPKIFDGCFTSFYRFSLEIDEAETNTTVTDYLQPEWANIRFFAGAAPAASIGKSQVSGARMTATGPSSLPCRFEIGASRMWGIGFLPLGWARFMAHDANACANLICDGERHPAFARFAIMGDVLTDPAARPEEQLAHIAETLQSLMQPHRDEAKIARMHTALVAGECMTVQELAETCAMSARTLERLSRKYFGFSPKLLMRRQRFMRSLTAFMLAESAHSDTCWSAAMDEEYFDQPQFSREFHEFMTMLPREYAALDRPILSSFIEARARSWGSAAQTLDGPDRA